MGCAVVGCACKQQVPIIEIPALKDFVVLRKIMFRVFLKDNGTECQTYHELNSRFKIRLQEEFPQATQQQITEAVTLYYMHLVHADVAAGYVESIP